MFNFIISLFLGMFPDILYLTLFISFAKNLKEKRIKLFILLAIGYILLIMICQYQFLFYIVYIIYAFLILKLLYKSNICDFFLCSVALFYMTIISYVGYMLLSWNYALYYIVERLVVYSIFIFKNKFNLVYNKYLGLWNRHENRKIKSITLRNSSLLFINSFIIILDLIIMYIVSIIK